MSYNYNKVTLVGYACTDVETIKVWECTKANFRIKIKRPHKHDAVVKKSDTFTVILLGRLGEAAKRHIKKGNPVLIDGAIQIKEIYYDLGIQVKRKPLFITEIIAENFQILGEDTKQGED